MAPGVQTPWPAQVPQPPQESHSWVPQLPQGCLSPDAHTGVEGHEHGPHVHEAEHVFAPRLQVWTAPGAQAPSPLQLPQPPQELQVWVPQLPQG
jgi:hypothetical protein